ncbi:hypothetical protein OAN307_c17360 [Octadecabacter antarcticus 307]|uniref:Uncharacterized protein n=1 Tax=Octadecabacter antarcticus 307 TaxID=391626 RepID=M9RAM5_9RHOB|nr:hypothetical protein OAN307_c17360 [Octadecabacter antarcticus 307]
MAVDCVSNTVKTARLARSCDHCSGAENHMISKSSADEFAPIPPRRECFDVLKLFH